MKKQKIKYGIKKERFITGDLIKTFKSRKGGCDE